MKDMNKIFLMGRLGADPAPKQTKTGVKMVTFPVATSKRTREGGEVTHWHRIVAWGKQSEQCASYLKKGQSVLVEGSVRTRNYLGKDGIQRRSVEVHADDVLFLGASRAVAPEVVAEAAPDVDIEEEPVDPPTETEVENDQEALAS